MPGTEKSVTRHPPVLREFYGISVFFSNLNLAFVHHFYTIPSKQTCYFLHFIGLYIRQDMAVKVHCHGKAAMSQNCFQDLRLHPKRYVHFSLFGRKDK